MPSWKFSPTTLVRDVADMVAVGRKSNGAAHTHVREVHGQVERAFMEDSDASRPEPVERQRTDDATVRAKTTRKRLRYTAATRCNAAVLWWSSRREMKRRVARIRQCAEDLNRDVSVVASSMADAERSDDAAHSRRLKVFHTLPLPKARRVVAVARRQQACA